MNLDLSMKEQVFQLEHGLRAAQAQRVRFAGEAARAGSRRPAAKAIGNRIGMILVAVGERLQGIPRGNSAAGAANATGVLPISQ